MATRRGICIFVAGAMGALTSVANGQFTDFQRMLFNDTEFSGNPNYISTPQGGPLFDNNIYAQRIQFNRLGQGWAFDQFRFFGPDSYDNPNTFDLGPLKLQLSRDPAVLSNGQPVGIHNRIGFTTTLIPEVSFLSKSGQRSFDVFSGLTNFTPAPIHYDLSFNSGVQNYDWNGNMAIDSNGKINALGFYDFNLHLTNVGNATADGVILHDESVTDFDTGPIHVAGNVLFDGLATLLQADGTPVGASPFRILSGATKDKKTDDLMNRLKAGERLSNDDMSYLIEQMFITAFLNDPIGFLTKGPPDSVPGFEGLSLTSKTPTETTDSSTAAAQGATAGISPDPARRHVPEPGTLVLVSALLASVGGMRSLHRRIR